MKTHNWLIVIAVLVLAALTFAQTPCPVQEYNSWDALPVQLDPNQISVHPITGDRLFLAAVSVELGRQWSYEGWACDEDGDAMTLTSSYGAMTVSAGNIYTLTATETAIGVRYVQITATDVPVPPALPIAVTGTLVVIVTPANHAPILCGGRP